MGQKRYDGDEKKGKNPDTDGRISNKGDKRTVKIGKK